MVAVTRKGLYGGARQPYGDFSTKQPAGPHSPAHITRLGLYGGLRHRYAGFVAKALADAITAGTLEHVPGMQEASA